MRRLVVLVLLAALAAAGCKRVRHPNPAATIEEESELASAISVADPHDASQLLSGFYNLEDNAWRWSQKQFAVSLAPPANGAAVGATLQLNCDVPDVVAKQMLGVAITPTVGATKLKPMQLTKAGAQELRFEVPPEALKPAAVIVQFDLDKAIEPSNNDSRQLGVVVTRIGFVSK